MLHSNVVEPKTRCCTQMFVNQYQMTHSNVGPPISRVRILLFTYFFISVGHSTCPDKIDFPIPEDFADKRSYITPTVAWARNEFIQTDLTKLFQKARRLPGTRI